MARRVRTRRHQGRRPERDERGTSLVEFALILPLFALMLFGMIDFGLLFGGFISLRNQVNAAGRDVAISQSSPSCASANQPSLCIAEQVIGSSELGTTGAVEVAVDFPNYDSSSTVPVAGQPVIVCAAAKMHSATGMTSAILNSRMMYAKTETVLQVSPDAPQSSYGWDGSSSPSFTCS